MKRVFFVSAIIAVLLLCCCSALADTLSVDMPAEITVGQDVVITLLEPEKYSRIYAEVDTIDNEIIETIHGANGIITLPDYLFNTGSYRIAVYGNTLNTGSSDRYSAVIDVSGAPRQTGPEIAPSKTVADINENVVFTIQKPGAESFVYWWTEYDERGNLRRIGSPREMNLPNQFTASDSGSYGNGSFAIFVTAYADGAWTAISQCRVNLNAAPKLNTPVCELPADAELGKPIPLTIFPVDNAQYYQVSINYQDGSWYSGTRFDAAGTYNLDITEIGTYTVRVAAEASGWETSNNAQMTISVTGTLIDGPEVSADKEEYRYTETIAVTAALPGADQFRFQVEAYDNNQLDSSWEAQTVNAVNGAAEYHFQLYSWLEGQTIAIRVRAQVEGVWTAESVVRVNVKSEERLATPSLTLPANSMTAGTPVQIEIGEVANAAFYDVYVWNNSTHNSIWFTFDEAGTHALNGLAEPGQYEISVTAYPQNDAQVLESKSTTVMLTLTGTLEPGPDVSADKAECAAGSEFTVTAYLPGAEKFNFSYTILAQDGTHWSSWNDQDPIPADADGRASFSHVPYSGHAGRQFVVYARAFINGRWTAAGQVTVNIIEKGSAETPAMLTPDFVLPDDLTVIADSAFEGVSATVVYVPDGCSSIGANAFGNCLYLRQIRLPQNCAVDSTAFDGCDSLSAIFAPAGGTAEAWARAYVSQHSDCVFVPETR